MFGKLHTIGLVLALLLVICCVKANESKGWSWNNSEGEKVDDGNDAITVAPVHENEDSPKQGRSISDKGIEQELSSKDGPEIQGRFIGGLKEKLCKIGLCKQKQYQVPIGQAYPTYPLQPQPYQPPIVAKPVYRPPAPVVPLYPVHKPVPHHPPPPPKVIKPYPPIIATKPTQPTVHHFHTHIHTNTNSGITHHTTGFKPGKTIGHKTHHGFASTVVKEASIPGNHGSNHNSFQTQGLNHGNKVQTFGSSGFNQKPLHGNFGPVKPETTLPNPVYRPQSPYYREQCQCVPHQYCPPHELVGRHDTNDIKHLLDPRNEKTKVLAGRTDPKTVKAEDESDVAYDLYEDDEGSDYLDLYDDDDDSKNSTTESTPSRKRRDTLDKLQKSTSDQKAEGRQLSGYAPGINGCGHNHVCCRNPQYNVKPKHNVCGKGNPSIHGRIANIKHENDLSEFGEYPWQAAILKNEGRDSVFVCGGTLVSDRHVLTAAHCLAKLQVHALKVRLGEWDVNRDTEFYRHIELPVASVIQHPQYYSGNLANDLAIVTIRGSVNLHSHPHISPICLPEPYTSFAHQRCHVTGWGKDAFGHHGKFQHILKELDVPVVDRLNCEHALRQTRLGRSFNLLPGFTCAGGEYGKDACEGDGGGPLVCAKHGVYQLAGVVSWGVGCGQAGVPGVYVDIPHYVQWIRSYVKY